MEALDAAGAGRPDLLDCHLQGESTADARHLTVCFIPLGLGL